MPRVSSRPQKVVATSSLPNSDEEDGRNGLQMSEAARTLFEQYMSALGTQDARDPDDPSDQVFARGMARVTEFLSSTGGDAAVCLICLSNIKPSEAVWSCSSSCFAVLHLPCIQEWARNQVDACVLRLMNESEEANGEAPLTAAQARAMAEWGCPKCRQQYRASELPRTYTCFCGKVEDPEWDPWVAPHTCGELCGKPLTSSTTGAAIKGENDASAGAQDSQQADQGCGHKCLLLCHPGPCPPCPRIVDASCYCGKRRSKRRCGHQAYSCGRPCGMLQPCGHPCTAPCHPPGLCPPCEIVTERPCVCGAERRRVACCEGLFHCGKPCGRRLACGNHVCEQVCHAGPCGECPHQGVRTCPCGKAVYPELKCTEKAPTCGATCGKLLPCGLHTCHDRCHHGECSSCRALVSKPCRCGKMTRQVLCGAELLCDRRCTKLRNCTRHPCKRRCCDGTSCPPCEEKCGRWLKCGNHKCPAPCHAGPCRPCPLTVSFQCACGQGQYSVPCGAESKVIAPRCNNPCPVPGVCRHAQQSGTVRHRCHYGPCPPCMQPCGTPLRCGHLCPVPGCHDPPSPAIAPFQQPQAPKARLVSVPAPTPRTGPAPLPDGTSTTTILSTAQEGNRRSSASSTKAIKGTSATKNGDGGAQNGSQNSMSDTAKNGEGPKQTPAPAIVAAMVASEILAASPLWGPPGSPSSSVPNWPSQCPPCAAPVTISCLGGHEQREVPCSVARPYSCTRPCGRPLACGNHRCCQPCHAVEGPGANAGTVVQQQWGWGPTGWVRGPDIVRGIPDSACERCTLPCMKERVCPHKCPLGCHVGPCPPCDVPMSRPCHCGKTSLTLPCHIMRQQMLRVAPLAAAAASGKPLPTLSGDEDLLSCQKPCHRALPHCPHFCLAPCHLGSCPHPEACQAEVTVRCECKRVRAKWACANVQAALAASRGGNGAYDASTPLRLLPCGPECPTTLQQQKQQQQQQQQVEQELQQQQENQEQQQEQGQAVPAKAAGSVAATPNSTKQVKAPTNTAPKAAAAAGGAAKKQKADQSSNEAPRHPEASSAAAAAAAGAGAGAGTKGSRHMSKAEKQAAAEMRRMEQERQERTKQLQSIAMWVVIVSVGLALGMLGPKLLS